MKLGLSTWSLLGLDLESAVRTIGEAGVGYIELWGELPHAYPGKADVAALGQILSSYDMTLSAHAPFTDLNPASPEPLVRSSVEKVLVNFVDICSKLGAVMVTVHPGSVHSRLLVEGSAAASISTLRKMVEAADGRLSVNVENQTAGTSPYYYPLASTPDSLENLLTELPDAKCTLDTGHAHASGLNPLGMAERLGGKLAEVHLSDNSGKTDEHLLPGKGNAPLERFMGKISHTDALVCLELNPYVYDKDQILSGFEEMKSRYA